MSVTNVVKDPATLTMTVTAQYNVSVERAWQLWSDPRQLERWWGPPTYPATVEEHDLAPGGRVTYFMTGPEGDQYRGWWRVIEVEAPTRLVLEDGFADSEGVPSTDMPKTLMTMELTDAPSGGTTMTLHSTFASVEAMEQLVAMGMDEGLRAAMGQIPDILAGPGPE